MVKRAKRTLDYYAELKKTVSVVHKFGFKTRKNFTPQQKAAITRMYNNYKTSIRDIEKGEAKLIKIPKSKYKDFPGSKHSNTGIIFNTEKSADAQIEKAAETAKFKSGGRKFGLPNDYIAYQIGDWLEILIPVPEIITDAEIEPFVEQLMQQYNPDEVSLQIKNYHAKMSYTQAKMYAYNWDWLDEAQLTLKPGDRIVTGVFLLYRNNKKNRRYWRV